MNGCNYDDIDVRNAYRAGFWVGAISGVIGSFAVCLFAGIYLGS